MKTILIVDDEQTLREALVLKFTHEGFTVLSASTGKEALAIVQSHAVDCILLDIMMPEMDGIMFVYKCREILNRSIPIIIMTNLESSAIPPGIDDVLLKSNTPIDAIVEKVKNRLLLVN